MTHTGSSKPNYLKVVDGAGELSTHYIAALASLKALHEMAKRNARKQRFKNNGQPYEAAEILVTQTKLALENVRKAWIEQA